MPLRDIETNLPKWKFSSNWHRILDLNNWDDASRQEITRCNEYKATNQTTRTVVEITHGVGTNESSRVTNSVDQSKARGSRRLAQNHVRHGPEDRVVGEHNSASTLWDSLAG